MAKANLAKAVAKARQQRATVAPVVRGLQKLLENNYADPAMLVEFGLNGPKTGTKSAQTKAEAAAKAKATRAQLGTKGTKQKKAALKAAATTTPETPAADGATPHAPPVAPPPAGGVTKPGA
jgi:hypothetical protein